MRIEVADILARYYAEIERDPTYGPDRAANCITPSESAELVSTITTQRELIAALAEALAEFRDGVYEHNIQKCPYCHGTALFRDREFEDDVFIGLGDEVDCPRCAGWRELWTRSGAALALANQSA